MDLIVHQVQELEYVHVADGDPAVERLSCPAIVEGDLATAAHTCLGATVGAHLLDSLVNILDLSAGEDGRRDEDRLGAILPEPLARGPPEMGLQDLADVHPARNAQWREDHIYRTTVLHERHVLLRHDPRDNTLVAVTSGELVALSDLALLGHKNPDHLVDA